MEHPKLLEKSIVRISGGDEMFEFRGRRLLAIILVAAANCIPTSSSNAAIYQISDTSYAGGLQGNSPSLLNAWGIDILVSNDGFGLGTFYRREFNQDLYGFVNLSVSEAKDDREVELVDLYGNSIVPGKLNRFLVIPLTFGLQRRLFREEILDTFRPYINAGIGPTVIVSAPYTKITTTATVPPGLLFEQVEFFESLGKAQAHYTLGGFIGFGANFGGDRSNLFGVNFRYYITYPLGEGLPSLYDESTGKPAKNKNSFGGFFITLNVGMLY
jgi:hypothetical protein